MITPLTGTRFLQNADCWPCSGSFYQSGEDWPAPSSRFENREIAAWAAARPDERRRSQPPIRMVCAQGQYPATAMPASCAFCHATIPIVFWRATP